ncbi:hypothetical protein [Paraburkholderia caribensis]|uniref:hypothetical protein n=1 Tax=Paraburkholderia caribensis TaxID=75105 RepID=UPI001CB6777D|nr:hypothetical protein [Paraburkholderia caribensis]CAG9261623.1 conserved hypothetical protein [Paraburkholderia caribensis]
MQFLFAMRVQGDVASITVEQRDLEVAYVRDNYAIESIRQVWSRADAAGACLLIEAASEAAARAVVDGLPLMKAGKLAIETFVPLQPYRGFAAPVK